MAKPTYDRKAAAAYASRFFDGVCSDGFVATRNRPKRPSFYEKVAPGTKFETVDGKERLKLADGSYIPNEHLDDCTHFVSCCIGRPPPKGEKAGGIAIPNVPVLGAPGHAPYGIISVPKLAEVLEQFLAKELKASSPASLPEGMEPGDVIVYYKSEPKRGAGSHAALYLGKELIAAHTRSRWEARYDAIQLPYRRYFHIIR